MRRRTYALLASIIEKIHILEVFIYAISVILIIFSPAYRIYGAFYVIFVWIVEYIFKRTCPLFILERRFRIKSGEKITERRFLPLFFKKYFNINLSSRAIDYLVHLFFIIALFILVYNFLV